jgi:hypothetical protein
MGGSPAVAFSEGCHENCELRAFQPSFSSSFGEGYYLLKQDSKKIAGRRRIFFWGMKKNRSDTYGRNED